MTTPTHILLGLVIGKATGHYMPAVVGSVVMDIDHLFCYRRRGFLSRPRQLFAAIVRNGSHEDERGCCHNVLACAVFSTIAVFIDPAMGQVFALAYIGHLLLDVLDSEPIMPLRPFSLLTIRGPVAYMSKREGIVAAVLLAVVMMV